MSVAGYAALFESFRLIGQARIAIDQFSSNMAFAMNTKIRTAAMSYSNHQSVNLATVCGVRVAWLVDIYHCYTHMTCQIATKQLNL